VWIIVVGVAGIVRRPAAQDAPVHLHTPRVPSQIATEYAPTKRQVTKRQVSKRPVSKRLKRQVYKTLGLQNVRFTKRQVYKTSGLQNVRLQKNIHIYSVLVVGGNLQVLLQPCLQAK
jgi:hypothetical protein